MNPIRLIRGPAAVLVGLASAVLAADATMPGWQIALIAVGAAMVAAAAVLMDRALAARRRGAWAMHADQTVPPAAGPGSAAPARAGLSFLRIVDVPFRTCVAALETWPHTGHDGRPVVCGPVEHERDGGTCRVQVRLARGPMRPALRMRLQADHWSFSPPRTALELIPCGPVRPSAAYFRAGHLLLDQLTRSLARPWLVPDRRTTSPPHDRSMTLARFMDFQRPMRRLRGPGRIRPDAR
jgi:hypothetical protein